MKLWKKYGIRIKIITLRHTFNKVLRYWQRWCRHVLTVKGRTEIRYGYDSSAPLIKLGPGGDYVREYYADETNKNLVHRKYQQGNAGDVPAPPVSTKHPTGTSQPGDFHGGRGGILKIDDHDKRMFSTTESGRGGYAMATPSRSFLFG